MMATSRYLLHPELDGKEFINIYTRGKTRLGRLLSNLADVPVYHDIYGTFRTAEGLWYYLKTGRVHESLRALDGFEAKRIGRTYPVVWFDDFQSVFKVALRNKIDRHRELRELFVTSTLPFEHFYLYESKRSGVEPKVIVPKDVQWLTDYFMELREQMRAA